MFTGLLTPAIKPQRVTMQPLTFKDRTCLPQGTQIAWPAANILQDPRVTPDPETFNPWRSIERKGYQSATSKQAYRQTSKTNFMFGHGRQACPGRFFAVAEIKMILARMLVDYDFKFTSHGVSPRSFTIAEFVIPNPFAKLSIKTRKSL
jgi:cytochrome P450